MNWNTEAVNGLRELLALSLSISEIAARLGTTRGAVAGKSARLRAEAEIPATTYERPPIQLPPRGWVPANG